MKAKRRLELQKAYGHLYEFPKVKKDICIYCGEYATTRDHVPPLSMLDKVPIDRLIDNNIKFYIYPSCMSCNIHLGNQQLVTLFDRLNYLFDKYAKKVEQQERWTDYELSGMSGRLKQFIQNQQYKVSYYNRKLEYIDKTVRNLLNDELDDTA